MIPPLHVVLLAAWWALRARCRRPVALLLAALTSCIGAPGIETLPPPAHCDTDAECPGNDPPPGDCLRWRCVAGDGDDGHGCARLPLPVGAPCTNGRQECTGTCDGSQMDRCALTQPQPTTCAP